MAGYSASPTLRPHRRQTCSNYRYPRGRVYTISGLELLFVLLFLRQKGAVESWSQSSLLVPGRNIPCTSGWGFCYTLLACVFSMF